MRRLLGSKHIMTLVELKYPMNNPSALVGIRGGSMEGGQALGSVLVGIYDAFSPCL